MNLQGKQISLWRGENDANQKVWCWIHDKLETWNFNFYQYCFECHHIYQTAADLMIADQRTYRSAFPSRVYDKELENIFFCPLCLHDFIFDPNPMAA